MAKGMWFLIAIVIIFNMREDIKINISLSPYSLVFDSFNELDKQQSAFFRKRKKSKNNRTEIKKLCNKAKSKIIKLDKQGRRKSTITIQRCKRAYSDLRYQACHMKRYNERVVDAAKGCKK